MKVQYFDSINVVLPEARIYSRLGYSQGKTNVSAKQQDKVEVNIQKALQTIKLKGAALRLEVRSVGSRKIILHENVILNSKSVAKLLVNANEVIFAAATCGQGIMKLIRESSKRDDLTSAVIYDAVASEVVDEALGWIMNYYSLQLKRESKRLTDRRFSAGYADFGLENQKIIYEFLGLNKLGIRLTDKYILTPEKSVTALAGITHV